MTLVCLFSQCKHFAAWLQLWRKKKTGLESDKRDREGRGFTGVVIVVDRISV